MEPPEPRVQHGVTRKQRHATVRMLAEACGDDEYVRAVEQCLYDGYFGLELPIMYNMYRGELYRNHALDLLWNMRRNAPELMEKYPPELLVALPRHMRGTDEYYDDWVRRTQEADQRERELRAERMAQRGEGWLKCPKCGGKFEMSMLQLRSADEPATIFLTCQRCQFVKRK